MGHVRTSSTITSCYATSNVKGGSDRIGGLVGYLESSSNVTNCYAVSDVKGQGDVGGLVGERASGTITASYYDSEQSSATKGIGSLEAGHSDQSAVSKTTSELQAPTDYSGIYADWDAGGTDHWDFLGANRYPKLKADLDGNATATVAEFGAQLLVFVDADGVERRPVFRIAEGTTPGTTVGTLSALNAESNVAATAGLVGTSDEFELSGSDLNVKAAASFDYQTEHRYRLVFELEEGGLRARRSVFIEIINPNDDDLDGLIGITTLAQLNAIRYDLNGDGMVDNPSNASAYEAAFGLGSGESACASGCVGYELMKDLDFEDANADGTLGDLSIWAEGASTATPSVPGAVAEGWVAIGTGSNPYTATFEGNGYTISKIFIDRTSNYTGLFARVKGGTIRNLGIDRGNVKGGSSTGILAGLIENTTIIESCYVTGSLEGAHNVGGLVGYVQSSSSVISCYSTGSVNGANNSIGGLVGHLIQSSSLIACYSTEDVRGSHNVGGLVGRIHDSGAITACYSMGDVSGNSDVGGLVGERASGTITASYYDSEQSSAKGIGSLEAGHSDQSAVLKTISELQAPTDYSGIYADWNTGGADHWDFLGANRYPKLKADLDGNATATVAEFGAQLLVFVDADGVERRPVFRIAEGTTPGTTVGTLSALNAESNVAATAGLVGTSDEFELSGSDLNVKAAASFDYQTEHRYRLVFELEEGGLRARRSVFIEIINPNDDDLDGLIGITTLAQLNAIRYDLNGDGMVDNPSNASAYEAAFGLGSGESACASGCVGYELMNDLDFEDANADGTLGDLSIWAEGASTATPSVPGAVAEGWVAIGTGSNPYTATFEGNGYTISKIFVNRPSTARAGLFGQLEGGTIRGLGLKDGHIIGGERTGALVGEATNNATISSCYSTASIDGRGDRIGGLVGHLDEESSIRASYSTGNVEGSNHVGGLVGRLGEESSIRASYSTGNVEGGNHVGGLVGHLWIAGLTNCYATGDVEGEVNVGGLVGYLWRANGVTNCYATGDVEGNDDVGGLLGDAVRSSVVASYSLGNVSGDTEVGGLVGYMDRNSLMSCYATAT